MKKQTVNNPDNSVGLAGISKKFFNYFSIFTIVLGSTFGTLNSAYAGDVAIADGGAVTAANKNGDGTANDAISTSDSLVFAGDGTLATGSTLVDVAEIESGTANTALTLSGTGGVLADILTATKDLEITVNDGNFLKLGGTSSEVSEEVGTIDLVDSSTFEISAASTNVFAVTADADGDGTMTISAALTQSDTIGSASLDIGTINANAAATINGITHAKDINVAANTDFTVDVFANTIDISGTSTTLTLGDKLTKASGSTSVVTMNATGNKVIVDGADTIAGDLIGATDGFGEVEITGAATLTGDIGTSTSVKVGLLDVNEDSAVQNMVWVDATTVANSKTLTVSGAIDDLVFTGTVDGDAAGQGTVVINNSAAQANAINFTGALGSSAELAAVTLTTDADFQSSVKANAITVASGKIGTFLGDVVIGAADLTSTGTSLFAGTSTQTLTSGGSGELLDGAGTVSITNTSNGGVVFDTVLITDANLDVSIGAGARAVFNENGHTVEEIAVAALGVLKIDSTVVSGETVFTTTTDQDENSFPSTSKVKFPSNLVGGQSLTLLKTVKSSGGDATAATVTAVDAALVDTLLVDYSAAASDDDVVVSATDRSDVNIASEGGITVNDAKALKQVRTAMNAGTAAEQAAFTNAMTAEGGYSDTEDTALAKQVAPQTDLISGSSVAAQAVTGSVQGIMSSRMASLRSGDAYFGTGVAAGGMSAQSGFIQVFGSTAEQNNTTVGSGTQYGYESDTEGLAIGFDGVTDDGMTIGVSLATANTDVDGKGTGKSTNSIDTYSASLYMDRATDAGYIEGSLTYGINENSTSRKVNKAGLDRTYSGSYDSQSLSINISAGAPNEVGVGYLTPFGSFTASFMDIDSYTEKSTVANDALRLKVAQDDINSMIGTLGLKYHAEMGNGGTPMISLAINNEFGDGTIDSTNSYQGGGTAFKTSTVVEELSATLGLGYSYGSDATSIEFAYEADVNDDEYLSHYGSVKIVGKF